MAFVGTFSGTTAAPKQRHFFGPWADFLLLGGGSLIAIPLMGLAIPTGTASGIAIAVVVLSILINHPHFAHSYQIFYGSYCQVLTDPKVDRNLRRRYLWAGLVMPALAACYFALSIGWSEPAMLRWAANLMLFLGGWHYAKQGYGMLMIDAALKRSFFGDRAKKALLANGYACWALSWLLINKVVAARDFLGLAYYTIPTPDGAVLVAAVIAGATTLATIAVFATHALKHGAAFPVNGVAAYGASLYLWLFLQSRPELVAFIPAFHSLQYLVIVWRYRMNVEAAKPDAAIEPAPLRIGFGKLRFGAFVTGGVVLGFIAFYFVPALADAYVPYDQGLFGSHLFLFMSWVFINVHHFFIDNAMWRKEHPHTMKHLFSHP